MAESVDVTISDGVEHRLTLKEIRDLRFKCLKRGEKYILVTQPREILYSLSIMTYAVSVRDSNVQSSGTSIVPIYFLYFL